MAKNCLEWRCFDNGWTVETFGRKFKRCYLLRVINTNRFTDERFRYHYILENPVTKKGLYEILRQQLSNADIEKSPCFQTIRLTDTFWGDVELDMECNEPFF